MRQSKQIEDKLIRDSILSIEKRLDRIESIPQMPRDSTVSQIVDMLNKITNSMKRNR